MENIELLKNHAINIIDSYARYYGKQNSREIDGMMVPDSLFIVHNNDKFDVIVDKVITYLCAYMNIKKEQITKKDYMDIKSILMVQNNITIFNGTDVNPDYIYDFTKATFCECHNLGYNDILDSNLANIFDKVYIDSFFAFEFKKYLKLYEEYKKIKSIDDKTIEDESRMDTLEKIFTNLQQEMHVKYNRITTILKLKEKNLNKELISENNFNMCFIRELMKLYDPINNDKDWSIIIKNYIKENDEYNMEKLENVQLEIGNYNVKKIISDDNSSFPGPKSSNTISYLDDDNLINKFFDNYFQFFEIGFRKFEDISKENTSRV